MLTRDEIVERCDRYCAAVSARNVDAIVALFAPDATQYEPIGSPPNIGHDAIRAFFSRNPGTRLEVRRMGPVTVVDRHAAMQIRVSVVRDGVSSMLASTDLFEFDDDGLIVSIVALPDRQANPDVRGTGHLGSDTMQRVEVLSSVDAIRALKARYFRCIDTKDWEGLRDVFTEDATMDMSDEARRRGRPAAEGVTHGGNSIVERIRTALHGVVTVHHGHTPEITVITPTEAVGTWAMEDLLRWDSHDSPLVELRGFGHYHETYRQVDGEWRIAMTRLVRLRVDVDPR